MNLLLWKRANVFVLYCIIMLVFAFTISNSTAAIQNASEELTITPKFTFPDLGDVDTSDLQGDVTNLQNGLSNTREDVTNLQNGLSNTRGDVTNLQNSLSNTRGDVTTLQTDLANTNGDVTTLQTDLANTNGDVTTLQTDLANTRGDVATLQTDLKTIDGLVKETNDTIQSNVDEKMSVIKSDIANAKDKILEDTDKLLTDMVQLIDWLQRVNNYESYVQTIWERTNHELSMFDIYDNIMSTKCYEVPDLIVYRDHLIETVLAPMVQLAEWKESELQSIDSRLTTSNVDSFLLTTISDELKKLDPENNIEARIILTYLCYAFPTHEQDKLIIIADIVSNEFIVDEPFECGIGFDDKVVLFGEVIHTVLSTASEVAPEKWNVSIVGEGADIPIPVQAILKVLSGVSEIVVSLIETKKALQENCAQGVYQDQVNSKLDSILLDLTADGGLGNLKQGQDLLLKDIQAHEDTNTNNLQTSIGINKELINSSINTTLQSATDVIHSNQEQTTVILNTIQSESSVTDGLINERSNLTDDLVNERSNLTDDLINERFHNTVDQINTSSTHVIDVLTEVADEDIQDLSEAFEFEITDLKNTIVADLLAVELEVDLRIDEDTEKVIVAIDDLQKKQDEIIQDILTNRTEIIQEVQNTELLVQSTHDDTVTVVNQTALQVVDSVTNFTKTKVDDLAKLTTDEIRNLKSTIVQDLEITLTSIENTIGVSENDILTQSNENTNGLLSEIIGSESAVLNRSHSLETSLLQTNAESFSNLQQKNSESTSQVISTVTESFSKLMQANANSTNLVTSTVTDSFNEVSKQYLDLSNQITAIDLEILTEVESDFTVIQDHLNDIQSQLNTLQFNLSVIEEREIESQLSANQAVASFYLPEQYGGKLRSVKAVVQKWMRESESAGMSIAKANYFYSQAEQKENNRQYKDAFYYLAKAYNERDPLFSIGSTVVETDQPTPTPIPVENTPVPTITSTPTVTSTPTMTAPTPIPTFFIRSDVVITDTVESNDDLSNATDFDTSDNRALVIQWNTISNYDIPELTDVHIYVQSSQDPQFRFLGRTNDSSTNTFIWNDSNPFVRNAFRDGPEFGETYTFQVYLVRPGLNSFFGPFVHAGPVSFDVQN